MPRLKNASSDSGPAVPVIRQLVPTVCRSTSSTPTARAVAVTGPAKASAPDPMSQVPVEGRPPPLMKNEFSSRTSEPLPPS